jgi:hypothetical protein
MAGKALVNFADFLKATNKRVLTGPEEILNDAVKRTYGFFHDMLLGRDAAEVVRGGAYISETIQLDKGSQFEFYRPGQRFSPAGEDTASDLRFDWRFAKDVYTWTDQEVMLNDGDEKTRYKRLKKIKQQACATSLFAGIEDAWISAAPDSSQMETSSGLLPFSLRALVTEDGGPPDTADGASVVWTTVCGVNPDTKTNWKNQVESYTGTNPNSTLRTSFGKLFRKLKFVAPRTREQFFEETRFKKMRFITSAAGQDQYETVLALGNDSFRPSNDAGSNSENPVFRGIPIEYVEAMDDISYTYPRYFGLNFDYLYPVFHEGKYLTETDPISGGPVGQPESWAVYKLCWYQMICRSRRRQGIIIGA